MFTSDLKKGDRVRLTNGWMATILDNNRRGTTRVAEVEGFVTECGSVYDFDIESYFPDGDAGSEFFIELTPKQTARRSKIQQEMRHRA